jgi:hypothetical protein
MPVEDLLSQKIPGLDSKQIDHSRILCRTPLKELKGLVRLLKAAALLVDRSTERIESFFKRGPRGVQALKDESDRHMDPIET